MVGKAAAVFGKVIETLAYEDLKVDPAGRCAARMSQCGKIVIKSVLFDIHDSVGTESRKNEGLHGKV